MSTTRRAVAVLGALLVALAGALLWSPAAKAARTVAPATVTITYAPYGLSGATVTPSATTVPAGGSVAFKNADRTTLTVAVGSTVLTTVAKESTSAAIVLKTAGTVSYTASSPLVDVLGIVTRSVNGSVSVTAQAASPPPGTSPSSTGPSTRPTSGASGSAPPGGGGSAPGSGGGSGVPGGRSAPFSSGYPGGVVGGTPPPPTGSVLASSVAPYATSTAPNGVPTTLFTTYPPTPVAGFASGGGGGGSGRALGLTAAVTAVLLAGLIAAFGRLLLAHPAAKGVSRHR